MKNAIFQNFFCIISFLIVIFLINDDIISLIVWKFTNPFVDYLHQITWLKCNYQGFNLFSEKSLECPGITRFNYGKIFLILPYNELLDFFYTSYLPYILVFLFIFSIKKIINPNNKITYFLFFISIFNPSTILLLERANIDLVIFLLLIFIVYNRLYIINWFLIIFFSLVKIYPFLLSLNILLENKKRDLKNIILISTFFLITCFIYFISNLSEYNYMLKHLSSAKAGYHYLYSLNTLPKILRYLTDINYIVLIIFFYILFIYGLLRTYKVIKINLNSYSFDLYKADIKLFLLSGYLSLFCFFVFSNWFYREVFLIATYPLIINLYFKFHSKFSKILINLVIFRYLFLYVYAYFNIHDNLQHINGMRVFSSEFILLITLKGISDFFLMLFIGSLLIFLTIAFLQKIKTKTVNKN